jgi:integrase/recombinase XerD
MYDINQYIELRKISGISKGWIIDNRIYLSKYLKEVKGNINQKNTINYLNNIQSKYSITGFRKQTYQIRKFLLHLGYDWANKIQPPPEPMYIPKRVDINDIKSALTYIKENKFELQLKTLIYLGITTGMRAKEIYQLKPKDIDIKNRIVHINHNPKIGQTTKTKQSRVSFFPSDVKELLKDYIYYYTNGCELKYLFGEKHLHPIFRECPIKVKHLRKYFSQEWDRRGGPTSIKKILMGHSMKGDVDLMHYNAQSEEDLKKIYDKFMGKNIII